MHRERKRSLVIKVDDNELAALHAMAGAEDVPISAMVRKWLSERYTARFGDATPPATVTKFGDAIKPSRVRGAR